MPAPRNRTLVLSVDDRAVPVPLLEGRAVADRVYCVDALEGLGRSPAADLLFADPPYDRDARWHARWIEAAAGVLREGGSMYVCSDWKMSGTIQS
ncbi:MAG TPA: hypothetical protein VEN81_03225, partial [Planctomycetota bacterium]|nr:hypothetical protein [Planctomycetota bacterium]